MKIGFNEATAMGCSTLEKDLELCEKAGFDCIEIRLDMLQEYLKEKTVKDLESFFSRSRLRPGAWNALYLYPEMFSENDNPQLLEKRLKEFRLGCEIGQSIGADNFVVVPPLRKQNGAFGRTRTEIFGDCIRILTRLSDLARPSGMRLSFELVGAAFSSVRTVEEANEIVKAVNRENVGFVFDSSNLYMNGRTNRFEAMAEVDPAKIFSVHLCDFEDVPIGEFSKEKRCFCGNGVIDFRNFLSVLRGVHYDGPASIETFRPEYWERGPEWVVKEAYDSTYRILEQNRCVDSRSMA